MKHPMRYPKHENDKGTVFGGECNRTMCKCGEAVFFNPGTYAYYCVRDAININYRQTICVLVDGPLSMEEMDEHHKKYMKTATF